MANKGTMFERVKRLPAEQVVIALLASGALALLWTGWSGHLSALLVTVGLFVAGGTVGLALHRYERSQRR